MNSKETLSCIVAVAMLIYSLICFASVQEKLAEMDAAAMAAEKKLSALENENRELLQQLECGESDEEMQRLARERLGLVLPGEKIFYFVTDREEQPWNWQSAQFWKARSQE